MNLGGKKRLAAKVLDAGISRVRFDTIRLNEIKEALTRSDITALIKSGAIKAVQKKGVSRVRARKRLLQKRKGRRQGRGSRKGTTGARLPRKKRWMLRVRALRTFLKELRQKNIVDHASYKSIYILIRGGVLRSKRHMLLYLQERKPSETEKTEKSKQKTVPREKNKVNNMVGKNESNDYNAL